ncbi:MAG: type II toxin-antitoxin system RelE/ParE family toxin [Candidatus Gracilibacteria bacterium]|jgi:mRNA interferase RelE/StbE
MTDKIKKFFDSQDTKTRERLKKKLEELRRNPFLGKNIKRMTGYGKNVFRLRVGDIRIIYLVNRDSSIEVLDIDYRGNIY